MSNIPRINGPKTMKRNLPSNSSETSARFKENLDDSLHTVVKYRKDMIGRRHDLDIPSRRVRVTVDVL